MRDDTGGGIGFVPMEYKGSLDTPNIHTDGGSWIMYGGASYAKGMRLRGGGFGRAGRKVSIETTMVTCENKSKVLIRNETSGNSREFSNMTYPVRLIFDVYPGARLTVAGPLG